MTSSTWPRGSKARFPSSIGSPSSMPHDIRLKIAVVGTGISGLSAAWLLSQRHDVTVYERADRVGGHSNTILASVGGRMHSRRHRLHRLQPADLSQPDGAVRTAQGADPGIGNVVWRFDGWRCARILRERPVGGVRTAPQPDPSPLLVDARGPCPLLPAGAARY